MFSKILVAIDNSEISKQVFDEALALAKAIRASLILLNVLCPEAEGVASLYGISSPESPFLCSENWEVFQQEWKALEKTGLELLRKRTMAATAVGVNAKFAQAIGNPGQRICTLANTWNVDLIVVGRRGFTGLNELLAGSVSNYVLHHAPCSVLAVQGQVSSQLIPEDHIDHKSVSCRN